MKQHLLLIDDDADEFDLIQFALEDFPELQCSYANNGLTGIEMIQNIRPTIVFLDMNMPRMNGLECLKQIRRTDNLQDVPVFMYSNSDAPTLTTEAIALGAKKCLKKPLSVASLKTMLENVLQDL